MPIAGVPHSSTRPAGDNMRGSLIFLFFIAFFLSACFDRVEGTGRRQWTLFSSPDEEAALGLQAYNDVLTSEKKSTDAEAQAFIVRVGKRLAAAAPDKGFKY